MDFELNGSLNFKFHGMFTNMVFFKRLFIDKRSINLYFFLYIVFTSHFEYANCLIVKDWQPFHKHFLWS